MTKLREFMSAFQERFCQLLVSREHFYRSEIFIFGHAQHDILETPEMKHDLKFNLAAVKPHVAWHSFSLGSLWLTTLDC